jgi:hypothetical protein
MKTREQIKAVIENEIAEFLKERFYSAGYFSAGDNEADSDSAHLTKNILTALDGQAMDDTPSPGDLDLLNALELVLPLAERYLSSAPSHPDNAKLETARGAITKARE